MLLTPAGIANRCITNPIHQYPAFIVQFAELNVQTATSNDQCAELNVQSGTFNVRCGTLNVQLATFNVQDGTLIDQLATLNDQSGTSNVRGAIPIVHGSITPFHFLTSNK